MLPLGLVFVIDFDEVLWLIYMQHPSATPEGVKFHWPVDGSLIYGTSLPSFRHIWFEVFPMMLKIVDSYEGNEHKHHYNTI